MADSDKRPPLPPALRREVARLRSLEPSEGFEHELGHALARADAEQARGRSRPRRGPLLRWAYMAALVMPMAIGAFVVVHLDLCAHRSTTDTGYLERFDAVDVVLGRHGPSWLDVDLSTHHHKSSHATVHIEAPPAVAVRPAVPPAPGEAWPRCEDGTCVYRFDHPATHGERPDLHLGIRAPGHYRIRVEHVSRDARVREEILVRARNPTAAE